MAIKQVTGTRRKANTKAKRKTNAKNPGLTVYHDGRTQISVLCKALLAITGITDKDTVEKVVKACENVKNPNIWTKEDVLALTDQLGRMPYPQMLELEHLVGKKSLLMSVATQEGEGVVTLSYPEGSNRPWFSTLTILEEEGIRVPKGMCLEVPVALVQDGPRLMVEAALLFGVERAVKKDDADDDGEEDEGEDE